MADKETIHQEPLQTLADDQIVTERKLPRRSFLATSGAFLAGAAAIVSGVRASAQEASDPDKKKSGDPDKTDPDKKKGSDPDKKKSGDPDKADPDKKKSGDPDKTDPDKKKAAADPDK